MECGAAMKTKRENYRYDASGLSGVTLFNVDVSRCPKCGESEVQIPHIEALHRTLAMSLIRRRERLSAEEIRFLRKYLGLSGTDFAQHLGVSPETVSRWEQGKKPMGPTADRFLRWLVATREPMSHYPLTMLKDVASEKPKRWRVGLKLSDGGWHPIRQLEPA
jgi:putative zinc finger/helix-turn-helix YgiT family protein